MQAAPGEHEVRLVDAATPPAPADVVVALDGSPVDRTGPPVVAAVYDLVHLLAPRTLPRVERARRGWRAALLTQRADGLLAPSLTVARALVDYLRVGEDRLTWLPALGPGWRRAPRAEVEDLRRRFQLKDRYFVSLGTLRRRKNLATLMAAWDRLWPELGDHAQLVVAGAGERAEVAAVLAAGARYLGPIDDAEALALLSGAVAWVSPSLAEGCSIGALEAMAVGTPPVVAAGTALADVVGDAGLVLAPDDPAAWAEALRRLLQDVEVRNRMAGRALRAVAELREADAARRALEAASRAAARRS